MTFVNNGRINILGPIGPQFQFADKIPVKECVSYRESLAGQWNDSYLSLAFFSNENMTIIQNAIRKGVYDKSNKQFIIEPQNCNELKIIMRSIFLQYSNNLPVDIKQQIITLNQLVTKFAIEQIYKEMISYIKYTQDASTMAVPLSMPINTSNKNTTLGMRPLM
jgi:hypothetical protein